MVRIGRYTAAFSLTALGILLLLDYEGILDALAVLKAWWPAAIVMLGVEVLLVQVFYRNRDTRIRFSFGTLLGALVLGAVVLVFTRGNDIGVSWLNQWTGGINLAWADSDRAKHSFPKDVIRVDLPDSAKQIAISDANGHVKVTQGPVDEIEIQAVVYVDVNDAARAEEIARESIVSVKQGDTISITAEPKSYGTGNLRKPRMDLTVTFPQGRMPDAVTVEVTNGTIRAEQLTGAASLTLDTKNGDILGQNIGGDLRARTVNGDIELAGLAGGADVETVNGDVRVREAAGQLTTTTVNGDIKVNSGSMGGDWKVSSTIGDVELAWPESSGVDVNADSVFGNIESDWPLRVTDHEASGRLGDGKWKVTAESNADISLLRYEP